MFKKIIVILSLIFSPLLKATDCVPLTYEQLSNYIHAPISYDVWYHELMKDGNPPELYNVLDIWNKKMYGHELICVWCNPALDKSNLIVFDDKLVAKRAYLCICMEPDKYVPEAERGEAHACLAFFDNHKIILITTDKPRKIDSSSIQVQELNPDEFWGMCLMLFEVANNPRI